MSTSVVVVVLTVLAALVVVLTRVRLGDRAAARRIEIARGPLAVHTVAGVLALLTWTFVLVLGDTVGEGAARVVGLVALVLWWTVALAGLLILARWLPARGRHAAGAVDDAWSQGPGLSVLAHVGMLVGVVVFTYAYVVGAV